VRVISIIVYFEAYCISGICGLGKAIYVVYVVHSYCWGYASSSKVLQEQTPSANPFKRSAEATTHEASVL
jgi:hypothetical protein